jgi:hypothetical protein
MAASSSRFHAFMVACERITPENEELRGVSMHWRESTVITAHRRRDGRLAP